MRPCSIEFFKELDLLINEIKRNTSNPIAASNKIIEVLNDKIHNLYIWLSNYSFTNPQEEIIFFKEQKPLLISKLIYFNKLIEIESNLPIAKEFKTLFLKKEIEKISQYSIDNSFFNQYYRSGATHNDLKYFTRNRDKNLSYYECHIINYDIRVSTSHDYNVAQILANDQLIFYLESKLDQINTISSPNQNSFNWTGNRIDFIELLYALQAQKVVNNGSMEMKELASAFGQIFNIELDETIYRSYYDIKNRKSNRTKFINNLAETLSNKMDEEDL